MLIRPLRLHLEAPQMRKSALRFARRLKLRSVRRDQLTTERRRSAEGYGYKRPTARR
jgi:hypothetical protein